MGFAIWIDDKEETVWAQGTHEYRPMGAAVIGLQNQFRERDFSSRRRCPSRMDSRWVGLFGSLVDVNEFLRARAKPGAKRRSPDESTRYV